MSCSVSVKNKLYRRVNKSDQPGALVKLTVASRLSSCEKSSDEEGADNPSMSM